MYNPKSELSYLYLSKIFKNLDKKDLQENNLNTVILIKRQYNSNFIVLIRFINII